MTLRLRRLMLVSGVTLGILLGGIILLNSPGYKLQPTELRQLNSVSSQVHSSKTALSQTNARINQINQAIQDLQKHLQDDINVYHQILAKAGE